MKVFAKFDEIPSMILEVIKEQNVFTSSIGHVHMNVFAKFDKIALKTF